MSDTVLGIFTSTILCGKAVTSPILQMKNITFKVIWLIGWRGVQVLNNYPIALYYHTRDVLPFNEAEQLWAHGLRAG